MTRILLVYKQHRFEVIATLVVGLFLIAGSLIEGYRFSFVHLPDGCSNYSADYVSQGTWGGPTISPECLAASRQWLDLHRGFEMNFLPTSPWMVPILFGILLGAGLVAREIETGTAPLSWALAGSRRRWLLHRMFAMALLFVPILLALGLASDYFDANVSHFNAWANFQDYAGRGVILVFWGLAAFTGTVALSTLFGRMVPAILVAVIVCLVVRGMWEAGANRTFLVPLSQPLVTLEQAQTAAPYDEEVWRNSLITSYRAYMNGQPFEGDEWAYYAAHPRTVTEPDGSVTTVVGPPAPGEVSDVPYPYDIPFGFRGDQYWSVIAFESAILLVGSALCAGIALFWVGRRKPY